MTPKQLLKTVKFGNVTHKVNGELQVKPEFTARPYTSGGYRSRMGRSTIDIACPFCGGVVQTFVWSLRGGGKRCHCGALFGGSSGLAYHSTEYCKIKGWL